MLNDHVLRQDLHAQIDQLPAAQLVELQDWLKNKQKRQQARILSYAGDWSDMADNDWQNLQDDFSKRRHNERRQHLGLD